MAARLVLLGSFRQGRCPLEARRLGVLCCGVLGACIPFRGEGRRFGSSVHSGSAGAHPKTY
eukprot:14067766-Alexandrium_andersonii.AAC.1